jgi:hypothetical protein
MVCGSCFRMVSSYCSNMVSTFASYTIATISSNVCSWFCWSIVYVASTSETYVSFFPILQVWIQSQTILDWKEQYKRCLQTKMVMNMVFISKIINKKWVIISFLSKPYILHYSKPCILPYSKPNTKHLYTTRWRPRKQAIQETKKKWNNNNNNNSNL